MGIILSCHPERSEGSKFKRDSSLIAQNDRKEIQIDKRVIIKPLSRSLLDIPILLPYQLDLLKWMSSYYLAPMVNCLEAMLPEIPKRLDKYSSNASEKSKNNSSHFVRTIDQAASLKARPFANNRPDSRPGLLPSQSIILVPTINKIPETLAKFPKAINYVVYTNELKASEKFAAWMKILSGEADYIFGSRLAIFTPCPNLAEIIIYDEHDGAYHDDRSPYYNTLTVAQKIAELTHTQVKIVDPSPKITTYFALPTHIKIQKFNQKVEAVDMQKERLGQNYSPLSIKLQDLCYDVSKHRNTI